jgi:2-aminoethylphosphonate-pyruvate transaminase
MSVDIGSRDHDLRDLTARMRAGIAKASGVRRPHTVIPIQGSGTFALEAVARSIPTAGHKILVVQNGRYGERFAEICAATGRPFRALSFPENESIPLAEILSAIDSDTSITHVFMVHCETSSGVLNPLEGFLGVATGKITIVDAMSTFGQVYFGTQHGDPDILIASSAKSLEGPAGIAFAIVDDDLVPHLSRNPESLALDLNSQLQTMDRTGEWMFTPPTHAILGFVRALDLLEQEGGPEVRSNRYHENQKTIRQGMLDLGFEPYVEERFQSDSILSFVKWDHPSGWWPTFYDLLRDEGFIIYDGRAAGPATFRVGCIGSIDADDCRRFLSAVRRVVRKLASASDVQPAERAVGSSDIG